MKEETDNNPEVKKESPTQFFAGERIDANDQPYPRPTTWNSLVALTRVQHLITSLILGLVGFGTCLSSLGENNLTVIIAGFIYLASAVFAVSSIIAVFVKTNPETGRPYNFLARTVVTLAALSIGGFTASMGLYWTFSLIAVILRWFF